MKLSIQTLSSATLIFSSALLSGCFHDDNDNNTLTESNYYAIIATSDFTNSDVSIISLSDYSIVDDIFDTQADISVSTNKEDIYVVGRVGTDNITKFEYSDLNTPEWQYSVGANTNPYKFVQKNETTAYVIKYATDKVQIVNPSATTDAVFVTGELDLSPYNDADGAPEASDGLLIGDRLYVMLESWDQSNGYPWILNSAYIAVFDTTTNLEIETNTDSNTPKGIKLITKNPRKLVYESVSKTLYVVSRGSFEPDYSGGIEAIDTNSFATTLVVDDGDIGNSPYGAMINLAILSPSRGYFVGSAAYQEDAIYSFNPTTKIVDSTPLMQNKDIADIEIGPLGNLWVAERSEAGVIIINTVDNSILKSLIKPDLPPTNIEFISIPKEN